MREPRSDRLRILYLRNLYWPADFGGNRYALEVTSRLARRGHQVRVVSGRSGAARPSFAQDLVSIAYYRVWRGNPLLTHLTNALGSIGAVTRALASPTDVVLVGSYDVGVTYFRRSRRPPSVYMYHGSFQSQAIESLRGRRGPARLVYRALRAYVKDSERTVLTRADRVIAVSSFSAAEIRARAPETEDRISVIPTGVDTAAFAPAQDRQAVRRSIGIPEGLHVAIVVGRLVPLKRYGLAIDVIAQLERNGLPTLLLVVGEGPERSALEERAARVGVRDRVRFVGYVDGAELAPYLQSADLQLCTSEFENLSLALLEGMAAGLPVAALPTGGTVDLLSAIDPSLLAADESAERLTEVAAALLRDAERRRALGSAARGYVVAVHDWEQVVDGVERCVRALT